jgi:outer membrane immunogenic protein
MVTKKKGIHLLRRLVVFLIVGCAPCVAQATHGDAALTYQWTHTNAQPGSCGCFGLNGGGLAVSWGTFSHVSAVLDVSGGYEGSGSPSGDTLTLVSYLAGGRYSFRKPTVYSQHQLHPFGQILVGVAHAGGGIAGAGDGTYAFAARAGGGVDLPLSRRWSVRLIQADYYFTRFANTTNNHQNNILLSAGAVVHWSR